MEVIECKLVFGGMLHRCTHESTVCKTKMHFSVYLPGPSVEMDMDLEPRGIIPALYYLSGLTCTDENVRTKGSMFQACCDHKVALIMPDTSPRGAGVPTSADGDWSYGHGAGFYVDATEGQWSTNYNMYSYIRDELPALINNNYPMINGTVRSLVGHSMGGLGALVLALRNPSLYKSVSALAPMCNPTHEKCALSRKAFDAYLTAEEAKRYDPCELLRAGAAGGAFDNILIDQGANDSYLTETTDLLPSHLADAADAAGQKLTLRYHEGYDHSYFFVASFLSEHIAFHAKYLHNAINAAEAAATLSAQRDMVNSLTGFAETAGKPIRCRAMVAFKPKEDMQCCYIFVAPPKAGEVRLKVVANATCHTDVYTLSGQDPEGLFPCILGHEAGAIVESVGPGVTSVAVGDKVIPCYTPQCCLPTCIFCQSSKTNLCPAIRSTQGQGVMPDGTSRFTLAADDGSDSGTPIYHFMGCSTFSQYTVVAEISCAKVSPETDLNDCCVLGCGVSTGLGAVWNNAKVETGSSVCVFGAGAVGMAVIQGAKEAGATHICVVDVNPGKFDLAMKLGATMCVNPKDAEYAGKAIQGALVAKSPTGYGWDYTFDCTGLVDVMRSAIECAHRGWGQACIIGVAASGHEVSTRPFQFITGRRLLGTAFGGFKSRSEVPKLVQRVISGSLKINHFITDRLSGVDSTNAAIRAMHSGTCLRCVVEY